MEILITANSPGEIAGWTAPVVKKIKEKRPDVRISVLLLPCAFASGREYETARQIPGVSQVFPVARTLRVILWGGAVPFGKDLRLLHLGGDLFYPVLLKKRLGCRLWSYEWARQKWDRHFEGYFARDELNRQALLDGKIPGKKIHVVGDLLVDSVLFREETAGSLPEHAGLTFCFMPGSRFREITGLLPVFAGTAKKIAERFPGTRFVIPLSPFLDRDTLRDKSPLEPMPDAPGLPVSFDGQIFQIDGGPEILTLSDSVEALKSSDFMMTIPGTSTGEAGALGVPHYCIIPLNRPEDAPYVGLVGMLNLIPVVGKPLKRKIMLGIAENLKLLAQPNLRAGREVVPEKIIHITPEVLLELVEPYLEDKELRGKIRRELLEIYSPLSGAAKNIADRILG